jgi:hypothetical protein
MIAARAALGALANEATVDPAKISVDSNKQIGD